MPIINYRKMKTIFDRPVMVNIKNLLSPSNLMEVIDHLANNKADGTTYAGMAPTDTSQTYL
jgi:hypothetical protein